MLSFDDIQEIGERIDRLMTVEIRPLKGGLPSNYVVPMYEACRRFHGQPLSTLAAQRITGVLTPGATVFIATGAGVAPRLPQGETDGPVGAGALAFALMKAFDARVVFVTETAHRAPVESVARELMSMLPDSQPVVTECFGLGLQHGLERASSLSRKYRPSAVIFVERDGPNREGFFHGVRGDCRGPDDVGHVYLLADCARDEGILSIGIGDGGNEVGFGRVRDQITAVHPLGAKSHAGHASGVVTVTPTDVVVSASVSNWGAYGVAAAMAAIRLEPQALYSTDYDNRLLQACVAAGARDGATSRSNMAVDGISASGHAAFLQMLHSVVSVSIGSSSTHG
ncbi:glutamate cyclase domain-containing protein [Paraburkholderia azotifigens]|uniref:Glutamate cyclase domain-containing protein n=1 Tax=Paraburkholderia azotifigens TaxID=2057004 RepID=A0ABU9R8M6_9BURK